MSDNTFRLRLPEQRDYPLGRHVEHDARSLQFPAPTADVLRTVLHRRQCRIYNQWYLGACTGMATSGALMTSPLWDMRKVWLYEPAAIHFYMLATQLDGFDGVYPPTDTGSSGLAAAQAAQKLGYISGYAHAFGLDHALGAAVLQPVITGVDWYDSFDKPDSSGYVYVSRHAQVRGGHEFVVQGIDTERKLIRCANSWGLDWGDHGFFNMSWETWDFLLHNYGDVTTFVH